MKTIVVSFSCLMFLAPYKDLPKIHILSQAQDVKDEEALMRKLRCRIIENNILDYGGPDYATRSITVLMDEETFSKDKLKDLFNVLSSRYSSPKLLTIDVITSEKQRESGITEVPDPPEYYEHHRAIYDRQRYTELFRYSVRPTDKNLTTVLLH